MYCVVVFRDGGFARLDRVYYEDLETFKRPVDRFEFRDLDGNTLRTFVIDKVQIV